MRKHAYRYNYKLVYSPHSCALFLESHSCIVNLTFYDQIKHMLAIVNLFCSNRHPNYNTQTQTQTHRQTDRQTDTDTHRHTDTHTQTHTHTDTHTHTHTHTDTDTHTQTQTHTDTHRHTQTHTDTHTHTHTHTHTRILTSRTKAISRNQACAWFKNWMCVSGGFSQSQSHM